MRLQRPRSSRTFRLECLLRRWIEPASQRKIGEPLLGYIGMLVLLVGAKGVKGLGTHNADDSAENVGLLEINVNEFSRSVLHMLDGFANVANTQLRRKGYGAIETP